MDDRATGKIDDDMKESALEEVIETANKYEMNALPEADEHEDPTTTVPSTSNLSPSEESFTEDIPEGEAKEEIMEILENVESPGTFAIGSSCDKGELLMPGLVVDGVGAIGLPLTEIQAVELSKRCEDAPFGRGAVTIVDKSVRNTFQLSPATFKITNPSWTTDLDNITIRACNGLGVHSHRVEAQLYKLLLYEEGSFFAPHRDNEKVDGMFGTLVIVLPSKFTGGELVVNHKGEVKTFDQGSLSNFKSQFAAFYADCNHELKRVTSGHRLCLVYNLVQVASYGSRPRALDRSKLVRRLKAAASKWAGEYDDNKIIIKTSHKYTPAGIRNGKGSMKYKGGDASMVDLLDLAIAEGAKIDRDHGVFSLTEYGTVEGENFSNYYHRRNRWRDYDDDDDGQNFTWGETIERHFSLTLSTLGQVDLNGEERDMVDEYFEDPHPEKFEPTGNEGVHAERQYADVEAIVIWPRSQRWRVVTNNDSSKMCEYLYKACQDDGPDSEPKEECMAKAELLIPRVKGSDLETLMKCIIKIGDEPLGKKFLVVHAEHLHSNMDQLRTFISLFGADTIYSILQSSINVTRFAADPTGTANSLIKYRSMLGLTPSHAQPTEKLINTFVDSMSKCVTTNMIPAKSVGLFPLEPMLDMFICGKYDNSGVLAKRVVHGYIWLSCQSIPAQPHLSSSSFVSSGAEEPKGPTLLLGAAFSLINLCESYSWIEYADDIVGAAEKLCMFGNADTALTLLQNFSGFASPKEDSNRSVVCSRMASTICDLMLLDNPASDSSHRSLFTLLTCKSVLGIVGSHNLSAATRYVDFVKTLDVDSIVYPLLSDKSIHNSATEQIKSSLHSLTTHCAQILKSRVSKNLGSIHVWSVPNAYLSQNVAYSSFLRNPCIQVQDWPIRKADHKTFLQDLGPLVHLGVVRTESYQPGGRGAWHFKITKLKPHSVPVSCLGSLACTCTIDSLTPAQRHQQKYGVQHQRNMHNCRLNQHKATLLKFGEDQKKFHAINALLPAEQRTEIERSEAEADNRKRPALTTTSTDIAQHGVRGQLNLQQASKKPKSSSEVIDLT